MNFLLQHLSLFLAKRMPLKLFLDQLTEGVIPIFMLHRIEDRSRGVEGMSPQTIDLFLKKLKREGYHPMGMDELLGQLDRPHGVVRKRVIFMMDDGYLDQIEVGVPVFQENNCPVSIAIITDFISKHSWPWDAKIRYLFETTKVEKKFSLNISGNKCFYDLIPNANKLIVMRDIREKFKTSHQEEIIENLKLLEVELNVYLPSVAPVSYQPCSWGDVKRLEGQGVNFIPHSMSHYILSNLSQEKAIAEIQGSINEINKHIKALPLFVYPNGQDNDFTDYHLKVLRDTGVRLAFSTNKAYLSLNEVSRADDALLKLPRMSMPEDVGEQNKVLCKIDYFADVIEGDRFKAVFEATHGIRRTAAFKMLEAFIYGRRVSKFKLLDFSRIERIVFVCVGNICRSPFAEIVALSKKLDIAIISMGIEASGADRPDSMAMSVADEYGFSMNYLCSTKIDDVKLNDNDLVVTMELSHLKQLERKTREACCQVTLLGAWGGASLVSIDDPYGRSKARFRMVFSHIQECVDNFMAVLKVGKDRL